MELNTYIEKALEEGDWHLDLHNQLRLFERSTSTVYCPITYAYYLKTGQRVGLEYFLKVKDELNLTEKEALSIMRAADGLVYGKEFDELREEMLRVALPLEKETKLSFWDKIKRLVIGHA